MADLSFIDLDGEKLAIVDPNASEKISVLEEEVKKLKETPSGVPQHTHDAATTSTAGFMSAADKAKLDGIATGANKYTLPTASDSALGGVKTGYTQSGKNYPVQLSSGKMYVNVPWSNTTYGEATQSAAGLMSATDKTNVDNYKSTLGSVTGKSDSLDTNNSNILATTKATKTLSNRLGGIEFSLDASGKGQYRAVGASNWTPFLTQNLQLETSLSGGPGTLTHTFTNVGKYVVFISASGFNGNPTVSYTCNADITKLFEKSYYNNRTGNNTMVLSVDVSTKSTPLKVTANTSVDGSDYTSMQIVIFKCIA